MKYIKHGLLIMLCITVSAQVSAFFVSSDDPGANVLGGAATGALIGGVAGGGRGAAIGAGVGLGLGAMTAASRNRDRNYYYRDRYSRHPRSDRRTCRQQLQDCQQENEELRRENYGLMQQINQMSRN
jgi:hypothetical protein